MSYTDFKIKDSDIVGKGVVSAPDKLEGTAQENKALFDRLIREAVKPLFNALVDQLVTDMDPEAAGALCMALSAHNESDKAHEDIRELARQGGKDGVSPTVEVTQVEGGHKVDVTDKDGTKSFTVSDGKDGKDGKDGESAAMPMVRGEYNITDNRYEVTDDGGVLPEVQTGSGGSHVGKGSQLILVPLQSNGAQGPSLSINGGEPVEIRRRADKNQGTDEQGPSATLPIGAGVLIRGVPYTLTFCGLYWLVDSLIRDSELDDKLSKSAGGRVGTEAEHVDLYPERVEIGENSNLRFASSVNGVYVMAETTRNDKPTLALYGDENDEPVTLTNVDTPTKNLDAANKKYVDEAVKSAGGGAGITDLGTDADNGWPDSPLIDAAVESGEYTMTDADEYRMRISVQRNDSEGGYSWLTQLAWGGEPGGPMYMRYGNRRDANSDWVWSDWFWNVQNNGKLPNPYALTFTGAVKVSYDGSAPLTVEVPSGGGGEEREWGKLGYIDFSVFSGEIKLEGLDNFTEFLILWDGVKNSSTVASGYTAIINGKSITSFDAIPSGKEGSTDTHGYTYLRFNGLFWEIRRSGGAISTSNFQMNSNNALYPYNIVLDVGKATTIEFGYSTAAYAATSGKITIWGR